MLFVGVSGMLHSQSIDDVKSKPDIYLWGESTNKEIKIADKEALSMLISQISTNVRSDFTLLKQETSVDGRSQSFEEVFSSVINTYSESTLRYTERIVEQKRREFRVFRYIKRSEIDRIFNERKEKILSFVKNAEDIKSAYKIADRLRYYYWALVLLQSHPEGASIKYVDINDESHLLSTWLPMKINELLDGVQIEVLSVKSLSGRKRIDLKITYNNQAVSNFAYTYWNGTGWSSLITAKNGVGLVEYYGAAVNMQRVSIKVEYVFLAEANVDKELKKVLSTIQQISFNDAYYSIVLSQKEASNGTEATSVASEKFDVKLIPKKAIAANGDIFVYYNDDSYKQLTFNSSDQQAILVGNKVVFIRTVKDFSNNWQKVMSVSIADFSEEVITDKKPYKDGNNGTASIFSINNMSLSLDGKFLYFSVEKWVSEDQIVRVNIETGVWKELFSGYLSKYIRQGLYKGCFLIARSEIRDQGRRGYLMIVDEDNNEKKVFDDLPSAEKFLNAVK